jgi:hypothetical protein
VCVVALLGGCTTLASKPVLVGCQASDTVTTLHATERGAQELNPFVAAILDALGPAGFIAAKAGVTLLVLHYHAEVSSGLLATVNVVTCGAAAHNVAVARKLPGKNSGTEP